MPLLVAGLALFFAVHRVPTMPALVARTSDRGYRAACSLIAAWTSC
jgi:hypothetical protein